MEKFNISTVLIAPLDWGLGHTTRCIPIIKTLRESKYDVIVAVNSKQKVLLQKEFSDLRYENLFGYNVSYGNNKFVFLLKIIAQIPKILWCIHKEKKWLEDYIEKNKIDFIISDNRYGFYSKNITSIFITHQLTIKAGNSILERILQNINYNFINKFKVCWIPDFAHKNNIAGLLSHPKKLPKIPVKYIGILSRFKKENILGSQYDLCILLSGPEPQRTMLEQKLLLQLNNVENKKILFIRGLPNDESIMEHRNCIIKNHLTGNVLERAILASDIVLARSGYTTIMELVTMNKKMILVPTPMQTEQEYLANYLASKQYCISYTQKTINLSEALSKANEFTPKFTDSQFEIQNVEELLTHLT